MEGSKVKLCIFVTRLINGGAQKVVVDLVRGLDRDRYSITLLVGKSLSSDTRSLFDAIPDGVRVVQMNSVVRRISPINDIYSIFKLFRFFRSERFDVLHLHTSKAGVLGSLSGYASRIKRIVYTPHGHIFHPKAAIPGVSDLPWFKKQILFWMRRLACCCCDKIVALSGVDLNEQLALKFAPVDKFTIIMNGINIEHFSSVDNSMVQEVSKSFNLGGSRVIGTVGRLSCEKGQDVLIRAFAELSPRRQELLLLIVGEGDYYDALQLLCKELGVFDRVVFAGNTIDVRPFLWNMDIFVLSSHYEAQGIALMEAMTAGVPVVASRTGGIPGIVTDGVDGVLVPADDPLTLAMTLESLLDDSDKCMTLVANAKRKAKDSFSVSSMVLEYDKLLDGRVIL